MYSIIADFKLVILERARFWETTNGYDGVLLSTTVVRGEGKATEIPATKSAR